MKFVVERQRLLVALKRAERIAARATTIPVLAHCLIECRKGGLTVVATDMDREIRVDVDAQVDKPASTTVDVRLLAQFVAGLADGLQVEASLAGGRLTVRAGRARAVFPVLEAENFPARKEHGEHVSLAIEGAALAGLLRSVAHAQSNEETRYYLNGVYLHRRAPRELVAVATDGHRLARTVLPMAADLPDFGGVILPRAAVGELADLAEDAGEIALAIAPSLVWAQAGDVTFSTKLIDGTFPDYERVIPPSSIKEGFDVGRDELLAAIGRVGVFTEGERSKARPIKFSPGSRVLGLLAGSADQGEISDELDAETTTKIPIGINAPYLAAALGALGGKTTQVRYADAGAPITFTDPAEPNRLQVVMARRV